VRRRCLLLLPPPLSITRNPVRSSFARLARSSGACLFFAIPLLRFSPFFVSALLLLFCWSRFNSSSSALLTPSSFFVCGILHGDDNTGVACFTVLRYYSCGSTSVSTKLLMSYWSGFIADLCGKSRGRPGWSPVLVCSPIVIDEHSSCLLLLPETRSPRRETKATSPSSSFFWEDSMPLRVLFRPSTLIRRDNTATTDTHSFLE